MYVRVHVVPGARKDRVIRRSDTALDISVREPAARNLANNRVRELLAETFGVVSGSVRLISGHRSPTKLFDVASENI